MMKSDKALLLAGGMLMSLTLAPLRAAAQTIDCNLPLVFGTLLSCPGAGTVTVTPSNGRSTTGCVTAIPGAFNRGMCLVQSVSSSATGADMVQISAPASVVLNGPGGATMQIDQFNVGTDAGGVQYTITAGGAATAPIGARLNIQSGQAAGSYSGSYTINANYQ